MRCNVNKAPTLLFRVWAPTGRLSTRAFGEDRPECSSCRNCSANTADNGMDECPVGDAPRSVAWTARFSAWLRMQATLTEAGMNDRAVTGDAQEIGLF